ncbi:MAG: peptidylprolyl isomerase [Myxococcota bacterium]
MTIANGTAVSIHYTLENDDGELLDTSSGSTPLVYLHGASNIVPGLERALEGKNVGDKVEVRVEPADGYGEPSGIPDSPVPRSSFPADADLRPGMAIQAETDEGMILLWLKDIGDEEVTLTPDHPLAGVALNFSVEVVEIREATEQEKEQGHADDVGNDDP